MYHWTFSSPSGVTASIPGNSSVTDVTIDSSQTSYTGIYVTWPRPVVWTTYTCTYTVSVYLKGGDAGSPLLTVTNSPTSIYGSYVPPYW